MTFFSFSESLRKKHYKKLIHRSVVVYGKASKPNSLSRLGYCVVKASLSVVVDNVL